MKKAILATILVLFATQAMALTGIEKADNRCKTEVNYYLKHTLGGGKSGLSGNKIYQRK